MSWGKRQNSDVKKPEERRLNQVPQVLNQDIGEAIPQLMREGKYETIQSLQVLENDDILSHE